jgi:hypothetical protein
MLWHLNHTASERGLTIFLLADKATDRQNNKKLVHFIVTYSIYNMRALAFFSLKQSSDIPKSSRAKRCIWKSGKKSITVTLSLWQFLFIQKFAAFGEARRKLLRSKLALEVSFLNITSTWIRQMRNF